MRDLVALVSPGAVLHEARPDSLGEVRSGGILLASDGSPASWTAARVAIRLARESGLELRLLYVPDGSDPERYREVLKQLTMMEKATGFRPGVVGSAGEVADRICEAAEATRASLIVLGHRGPGGAEASGGVGERVVSKAQTSVLLVPSAATRLAA